jgi:hypothetical protein
MKRFFERYSGFGIAAFLLAYAVIGAINHLRLYNELRDFGEVTQGTWISRRHQTRGDDPDLYEVTFEFSVEDQVYRVQQESQAAYDLYGGPGEPMTTVYSVNDPQQALVLGTISIIPPFSVWLLGAFGLVMIAVTWMDLRKKRRTKSSA